LYYKARAPGTRAGIRSSSDTLSGASVKKGTSLDPTFGGGKGGVIKLPDVDNAILYALARQPDGKLVFDPFATDSVGLCLFGGGERLLRAIAPAASDCGGRPCWSGRVGVGVSYRDRERSREGIARVTARERTLHVDASGANLASTIHGLPYAGFLRLPIVVQVHAGGACLGATLSTASWKSAPTGEPGVRVVVGVRVTGR